VLCMGAVPVPGYLIAMDSDQRPHYELDIFLRAALGGRYRTMADVERIGWN